MDRQSPGLVLTCNDALRRATADGAFVRSPSEAAAAMTSPALTLLSPVKPEPATTDSLAELSTVLTAAQQNGLLPAMGQQRAQSAAESAVRPAALSRPVARSLVPALRCAQLLSDASSALHICYECLGAMPSVLPSQLHVACFCMP